MIPPKGSIPPANRRRVTMIDHLSSMRAATRVGMTFVGSAQCARPSSPSSSSSDFKPRVISPNLQVIRQREAWQKALRAKGEQLEGILADLLDGDGFMQQEAELIRQQLRRLGMGNDG